MVLHLKFLCETREILCQAWSIWHSYDCSISWPDHRYSRNEGTADQIKACSIHRINTAYDIKNKDIQKRLLYYKNKDIDSTNISETVL